MKIEILEQKYNVGCGRGMAGIQKDNLLEMLNTVISSGPLSPGDCFEYRKNIIAVDGPTRLALILAEDGGPYSLEILYRDVILPQYRAIREAGDDVKVVSVTTIPTVPDDGLTMIYTPVPFATCKDLYEALDVKAMHEMIEITLELSWGMKVKIWEQNNKLWYDKEEIEDEELVKDLFFNFLGQKIKRGA